MRGRSACVEAASICSLQMHGAGHLRMRDTYQWLHGAPLRAQDRVYTAAYSSQRQPYSPTSFLQSWWKHAGALLEGYQQQVQPPNVDRILDP